MKTKKSYKTMKLDLNDEEFLFVAREAHKRDITFNAMCNLFLLDFVKKYAKNPNVIQELINNKDIKTNAYINGKKEKRIKNL